MQSLKNSNIYKLVTNCKPCKGEKEREKCFFLKNNMEKRRFLPSKRLKKRYIAFKIVQEISNITSINNQIYSKFRSKANARDFKDTNYHFLDSRFNTQNKKGIIRVSPKYKDLMVELLQSMEITTLGVSGTIKKAKKYITV